MRQQKLVWSGALLLVSAAVLAACSGDGGAESEAKQANEGTYRIRVQQSAPDRDEERARATEARLEQLAESIQEVKHANCVIIGDTAIVGIDVGGDVERSRVGTIKYAVAEALRKDPVGINAVVTADMDLNHRLQEIRQDINDGRPMQGIAEELADIVGRIVPQLPRDTRQIEAAPPEGPNATTQERGVQNAKSAQDGTVPSNDAGGPKDNQDFKGKPTGGNR